MGTAHTLTYVRHVYGDEVYGIFQSIKESFDQWHLQPRQKIVNGGSRRCGAPPALRPAGLRATHVPEIPRWSTNARLGCHAVVSARAQWEPACAPPSATRREHAAAGQGNLLRNIIQGKLHPYEAYAEDTFKSVVDYCIECGMCAVECPSNVNI